MATERERDPLTVLQAANPVPPGHLDTLVWEATAEEVFRRIVAGEALSPLRHRRSRWARVRVAGLVTISLSVAVAGYALVGRQPSKPQTVACFAAADLRAATAVVEVDREGPVAACRQLWAGGFFGAGAPAPLRGCVLESGVVGVFPEAAGRDVCLDLGLAAATPAPGQPDDPGRFLAFQDAAVARIVAQGCVAAGDAEAIVREELGRAGLEGWTVATGAGGGGFSAERPCASLSFLPEERTVVLVPLPAGAGGGGPDD